MGWVEADALDAAASLSLTDETALLVDAEAVAPRNVALLGIDPYGIDYEVDGFRDRQVLGEANLKDAVLAAAPKLI